MHVRVDGSISASGTQIQLNYTSVIDEVDNAKSKLDELELLEPEKESLGINQLPYVEHWLEREQYIHNFVKLYISILQQQIVDTKANIEWLKDQDEAITR